MRSVMCFSQSMMQVGLECNLSLYCSLPPFFPALVLASKYVDHGLKLIIPAGSYQGNTGS